MRSWEFWHLWVSLESAGSHGMLAGLWRSGEGVVTLEVFSGLCLGNTVCGHLVKSGWWAGVRD